jgi:hypothetical protein
VLIAWECCELAGVRCALASLSKPDAPMTKFVGRGVTFFSCFDVAGRYSATSNNCTNGLIRNNKDKAVVRNKFLGAVRA